MTEDSHSEWPRQRWSVVLPIVGRPGKALLGRFIGADELQGDYDLPRAACGRSEEAIGGAADLIAENFGDPGVAELRELIAVYVNASQGGWPGPTIVVYQAFLPEIGGEALARLHERLPCKPESYALVGRDGAVPREAPAWLRWLIPLSFQADDYKLPIEIEAKTDWFA